ncbi:hypothetical protein HQ520_14975 [bacterium]|nr:hypothetical protein [bacterium]
MRFKRIESETGREDVQDRQIQEERHHAEQEEEAERLSHRPSKSSLPIEWKHLSRFVESERSVTVSRTYLAGFWERFWPRLHRAIRQEELVREYLRETFWRRWALRAVAIAILVALALGMYLLHEDNQRLKRQMDQLEQTVRGAR